MTALKSDRIIGGRYRLETQIGEGGMGCVWQATQLSLQRQVAIKFLYNHGPDPERQAERFLREARIAASVAHRNVVDIVDFGVADQQPYMVMSLLKGETLADRLDRSGDISVGELTRIIALSLRGLAAVHEAGIVHRDLKPENIFLVDEPEGAYPKLLDFGISRMLDPGSVGGSATTTREGVMVGTPHYMSPEQARGLRDIDGRADLYSIGVILYEALTGQLPYESEHVGDLIILIVQGGAPSVLSLRPEIGAPVSNVIARAMHVDREARFPSALAMQQALLDAAQLATGGPIAATLSTMPRPARSVVPPNPWVAGAAASDLADVTAALPAKLPAPPPTPSPVDLHLPSDGAWSGPASEHATLEIESATWMIAPAATTVARSAADLPWLQRQVIRWKRAAPIYLDWMYTWLLPRWRIWSERLPRPLQRLRPIWATVAVLAVVLFWLMASDSRDRTATRRAAAPDPTAHDTPLARDAAREPVTSPEAHATATKLDAASGQEALDESDRPTPSARAAPADRPARVKRQRQTKVKRPLKPRQSRKTKRKQGSTPLLRRLDY